MAKRRRRSSAEEEPSFEEGDSVVLGEESEEAATVDMPVEPVPPPSKEEPKPVEGTCSFGQYCKEHSLDLTLVGPMSEMVRGDMRQRTHAGWAALVERLNRL